jgi:hypothetical protein
MQRRVLLMLAVFAATVFAAWYMAPDAVVSRRSDIDEGVYLMVARLLNRGYATSTFFFDQFWLFPKTIAFAFRFFGDSLIVGRLVVYGFSLAGLVGVAILSYQVGARWAAPAAIVCGAIAPLYLKQSRVAMSSVPGTTCLVWALVALLVFQTTRRRFWLILGGICAGASLTITPLVIGFAVTFAILITATRAQREDGRLHFDLASLTIDALVLIAASTIAAAPFVDLLHPIEEYRRTIGFHLIERNWLASTTADRLTALGGFARQNVPWLAFAALGIAFLRPLPAAGSALLAGALASILVLLQLPPWLHHYLLLMPVLTVFSMIGLERSFIEIRRTIADIGSQRAMPGSRKVRTMSTLIALVIALVDLPWLARHNQRTIHPPTDNSRAVIRYLEENTAPNDYLLSDDAMIPYLANRLIPPSAINLSFAATFKFDQASAKHLEATLRDYPLAGVVAASRYLRNPPLMSWIEATFPVSTRVRADGSDKVIAQIYRSEREKR